MDFLLRLHPDRAQAPGAARLDVAPRWLENAVAPVAAEASQPPDAVIPHAVPTGRARPGPLLVDRGRAAGRSDLRSTRDASLRLSAPNVRMQAPDPSGEARVDRPVAPKVTPPGAMVPVVDAVSQVDGARVPAAHARAAAPTEVAPPSRSGARPAGPAPSRAVPDLPLRIDTLVERRPPRTVDEPPVVYVTIDRIDVRLPPAEATAPPRERRPRAASSVAPLSDYLRGTQRGGRG